MVHAVATGAAITVVLVKPTSLDNTAAAVPAAVAALQRGISQGDIISVSAAGQIGGEHCVIRAQAATVTTPNTEALHPIARARTCPSNHIGLTFAKLAGHAQADGAPTGRAFCCRGHCMTL